VPGGERRQPPDRATDLPRAWWPKAVVWVDALPLLPNGKVDRLRARELATVELARG